MDLGHIARVGQWQISAQFWFWIFMQRGHLGGQGIYGSMILQD
jgi:hypothetical protein